MRPDRTVGNRGRPAKTAVAVLCIAVATACWGSSAPNLGDSVDRETFIETYVDLRAAAVRTEDFRVSDEQRDEILLRHGVDANGLIGFADVHGRDLEFMSEVWNEVEVRLGALPAEEDPR